MAVSYAKITIRGTYSADYSYGKYTVEAKIDECRVGVLEVDSDGLILGVYVQPEYRRKRVATALYETARAMLRSSDGVEIRHQPPEFRSPEGDAWAFAVGGPRATYDQAQRALLERAYGD